MDQIVVACVCVRVRASVQTRTVLTWALFCRLAGQGRRETPSSSTPSDSLTPLLTFSSPPPQKTQLLGLSRWFSTKRHKVIIDLICSLSLNRSLNMALKPNVGTCSLQYFIIWWNQMDIVPKMCLLLCSCDFHPAGQDFLSLLCTFVGVLQTVA